ncbi:hypothetical protein VZT92_018421 [Zoarces viviparus]|uniref:Uncharacterized protein n=1 Tax=Zoarces viviparus TaxID=48416 RepID=A0AAW1EIU3_ZOAVI
MVCVDRSHRGVVYTDLQWIRAADESPLTDPALMVIAARLADPALLVLAAPVVVAVVVVCCWGLGPTRWWLVCCCWGLVVVLKRCHQ